MTNTKQGDPPPAAAVMQMVMGAWISQTISTITRLDVPDVLEESGPCTASELVRKHGVLAKPELLERALRACASVGVVTEGEDGRFGPTPLSQVLTANAPNSVKKLTEVFGGTWWRVWGELTPAIREGTSPPKAIFGKSYWDYCKSNPKEMEEFGEAMKSNSQSSLVGILEHCDLSGVGIVADVAGGFGHLAVALLKKYDGLQAVVQEMPDLVPIAKRAADGEDSGVRKRLKFLAGDMFDDVPAANVYIMKHIMHDWHDDDCRKILRNCHSAMIGDGRIICVDAVLPPMGDTGGLPGKLLDVDMIAFDMGRERTEQQWRDLYADAGFAVRSITPLNDNFGTSIVEGRRT